MIFLNFEEAMKKLEAMSERIKDTDISLEEAISCYEEGIKCYNQCNDILSRAKQKIEFFDEETEE